MAQRLAERGFVSLVLVVLACVACASGAPAPSGNGATQAPLPGAPTPVTTPAAPPLASAGGTKPDPCTLLTPQDLQGQFGAPFQAGNLVGDPSAPHVECQWAKQGGVTASFTIAIDNENNFGCIGDVRPVSGVGEEACFGAGGLHVKVGSWDVSFDGTEGTTDDQLIALAKLAVPRI